MTSVTAAFAAKNPQAFGVLVTLAGVLVFVPDALVMRLIGGDMLVISVGRGFLAGAVLLLGTLILAPQSLPRRGEWFDPKARIIIAANAAGGVTWCSAMQHTSAANALLVLAVAPFLAAILSVLFLRERIDRATGFAIAAVFTGVLIIASGSLGQGRLLGDLFAFANAVANAAHYTTLRTTGRRNMVPHLALGAILGGLLSVPLADFAPLNPTQIWLILLSGAVILPLAVGLLILGPRYLPAPEVAMITLLEVILGPLLVWAVLGEDPGRLTLIGGAIIVVTIALHTLRRLTSAESPA